MGLLLSTTSSKPSANWDSEEADHYSHTEDVSLFSDTVILSSIPRGGLVLDLGCGNGFLTDLLSRKDVSVIGFDFSFAMCKQAQKKTGLPIFVANGSSIPLSNELFSSVVCSLVINNIPSAEMVTKCFLEAKRVLKQDGSFIVSVPHPGSLDVKTSFRETLWKTHQRINSLGLGEKIRRRFKGAAGSTIEVDNYVWPQAFLVNVAEQSGLILESTSERTLASPAGNNLPKEELDLFRGQPFFLVMIFKKS